MSYQTLWAGIIGGLATLVGVVLSVLALRDRCMYKIGYDRKRLDDHGYRIGDLEKKEDARTAREIQEAKDLGEIKGTVKEIHEGVQFIRSHGCGVIHPDRRRPCGAKVEEGEQA